MLEQRITSAETKLAILEDRLKTAKNRAAQLKVDKEKYNKSLQLHTDCVEHVKLLDSKLRTTTKSRIEMIVTRLYQYIFQCNDSFVIEFTEKRGVSNAEFYIKTVKDGEEILLDPIEEEGGGKVDVISLGLRLAGLILFAPKLDRILIFDEPLKFLSSSTSASQYKQRAADCLKQFGEEYGIQYIIVTHDPEFVEGADKKFQIELDNKGFSQLTEI